MAEISKVHDSDECNAPQRFEPESESDFDPIVMRKAKPGLKRLFLTFSVLFSFLIGFPFLWKSVEIYRSPLPFREIDLLSTQLRSDTLLFPLHFHVLFIGFNSDSDPDRLRNFVISEITKLTSRNPRCSNNYTLSVTVDLVSRCLRVPASSPYSNSYQCGSIAAANFVQNGDVTVDDRLASVFGGKGEEYNVVVVKGESERAVVGKYRHAWMVVTIAVRRRRRLPRYSSRHLLMEEEKKGRFGTSLGRSEPMEKSFFPLICSMLIHQIGFMIGILER